MSAYSVPRHPAPVDLVLDANEGPAWLAAALQRSATRRPDARGLPRYLRPRPAEAELAEQLGLPPERVLLTCGGDDALARAFTAWAGPGRDVVLPDPSFAMLEKDARVVGADIQAVAWPDGDFPVDEALARVDERTAFVVVVSPNNPTGAVIRRESLLRLREALGATRLLLDLAYTEFADEDLFALGCELPRTVCIRTFSKAHGLASLRVGYAVGSAEDIEALRAVGLPYAVARPSWDLARRSLTQARPAVQRHVERVRVERGQLTEQLRETGFDVPDSQANFVLARGPRAPWLHDGLAGLGIGVRSLTPTSTRVTCPARPVAQARLRRAVDTVTRPEALLFDMDGVLADVSRSYREAIRVTARSFDVEVTPADITAVKAAGNANNDWVVTRRLLARANVDVPLETVTRTFEEHYQGTPSRPGLLRHERPLVSRTLLERLRGRLPLGIVTGRPRGDAEAFLERFGLADLFEPVVTLEDAPSKPDPAPVRFALERLGLERAWLVGDTPDDVRAARRADVLPLGVVAPGEDRESATATLLGAGAARVLDRLDDLLELLP